MNLDHLHDQLNPANLRMLQAIADHGSFAAAARELDLVPSALSYRVRQLEDALDVLVACSEDRSGPGRFHSLSGADQSATSRPTEIFGRLKPIAIQAPRSRAKNESDWRST